MDENDPELETKDNPTLDDWHDLMTEYEELE